MNIDKAEYLQNILRYAVMCPQFADHLQGGLDTYCNIFSRSILNVIGAMIWVTRCKNERLIDRGFQYICSDFHFDISAMLPGRTLAEIMTSLPIDVEYANLIRMAASGLSTAETHDKILPEQAGRYPIELDQEEAHDVANEGVPVLVISAKHNAPLRIQQGLPALGHEAIVFPTLKAFDGIETVAQAGPPGIYRADSAYSFGDFWHSPDSDIKFFRFPSEV
jgi:hypothetical protein